MSIYKELFLVVLSRPNMNNRALYIVRQNYTSECFKCKKEKFFFTVYRCGKCDPQKVEKYCYECCEASLTNEDKEEDDDKLINALCMGCAFCYDYIHVSRFYKDQKKNGWQGLKYDCDKCTCCCSGPYCLTGSLCCCVPVSESEESESEEEETEEEKEKKKQEEEEREKERAKRKEAIKQLCVENNKREEEEEKKKKIKLV